MKQRSFVRKNGKIEIKKAKEQYSVAPLGSKEDELFRADKMGFIQNQACAFLRDYVPGEFDHFDLPKDLDLKEITHTFVIIALYGVEHVLAHLVPLGETYKAVIFDVEEGKPMNARVPLLPEQAEIIRLDIEKNGGR